MPAKGFKKHKPSLFSRFKKLFSSIFSPSPPPLSHHPSGSGFPAHFTANSILSHPLPSHQHPTHHLEDSVWQNPSFTHPTVPFPLRYPQGQTSTFQGPARAAGALNGAHNFIMNKPVFVEHNTTADNFMEKFLQYTIIGAEFDSSDRDPPPRCHPATRLAIIQRCLDFIEQCQGEGKLRWVVGPAGVGKSAVMQIVAEKAPGGVTFVSIFFSINGRADGSKAILTIAYQLAVKCGPYRQFIQDQINIDPSLLRKSLLVQFNKFIVEPFVLYPLCKPFMPKPLFEPSRRFLVVIDGLDECDDSSTQEELLGLVTNFCITYPTSPIAWIVASRPEPHITSFFDQDEVKRVYTKEEIKVDSDEACEEVQRYLRDELKKIQLKHPTLKHKREWPSEHEFTKIASSAGGLFAYAATVVRYIDDPKCRNPAAQLRRVLETIDGGSKDRIAGNDHPMAQLDALYMRILSDIPADAMINARKLVAGCTKWTWFEFRVLCNTLGLTEGDAYGAICHLQAVMKIPEPDKADDEYLSFYHKSFKDFLFDSTRSGFSDDFETEVRQLCIQASLRIIGEVPYDSDSVAIGEDISVQDFGFVKGYCDNIALSWPGDERLQINDHELRIELYSDMMEWISIDFTHADSPYYGSISAFHALTTRFTILGKNFPCYRLGDFIFGEFRHELTELGKLKEVPLRALYYAAICGEIDLRFTSPIESDIELSESWNSSCKHKRKEIGGLQQWRGWVTWFYRYDQVDSPTEGEEEDIPRCRNVLQPCHQEPYSQTPIESSNSHEFTPRCYHCSRRFARHFMNNQDLLATVFVDGTQLSYVEFSFVDPDDGVSEWRYRFCHSGPPSSNDA